MSVILPCSCKSEYQDEKYGKGLRLHNTGKEETGGRRAICTVCGSVKHIPESKAKKETVTSESTSPETSKKKQKAGK